MAVSLGWIGAAGLSLGALWLGYGADAVVDVRENPPAVICAGDWLRGCERTEDGVVLSVRDAPDLEVFFEGIPDDACLWHVIGGGAEEEEVLAVGFGTSVALADWPNAETVTFRSLLGNSVWGTLRDVRVSPFGNAYRKNRQVGNDSSEPVPSAQSDSLGVGGFVVGESGTGTLSLTVSKISNEAASDATMSVAGLTAKVGESVSRAAESLGDALVNGSFPYGQNAFSLSVTGMLKVPSGKQFRAGADDTASVTIGGATSSIGGEHAFAWGNWATIENGGVLPVSATFSSVGGPYDFRLEGLDDYDFYAVSEVIPYATLEVSPAAVVVPWDEEPFQGSIAYGPKDSRVTYSGPMGGNAFIQVSADGYTINREAFFRSGAQPVTATVTATQTYDGTTREDVAAISLQAEPTSFVFDPGVLSVNNAGALSVTGHGAHEHVLRYELAAPSGGIVALNGKTAMPGPEVEAMRARFMGEGLSTNVTWSVEVPWTAYYGDTAVDAGSAPLKVELTLDSKTENPCACDCAEGTQTENACVSFAQAFGRTPLIAGMPVGRLAIEEKNLSDALFTPAVLRYDHPMMRRLDPGTRSVTDPMGNLIAYGEDGLPKGLSVARDSRLEAFPDGTFRERFADRSAVDYDAEGAVTALISTAGVRIPVDELGITVSRDQNGDISGIASEADGSLQVVVDSPTAYRVVWRDTEGAEVKTFAFGKEGADTLLLLDKIYPTRWTWDPAAHDFTMTRGEGESAAVTARTVTYDGASVNVAYTVSCGDAVASSETQTLDSANGNALVGSTSGGRTTLSATRVTEGNGLGRTASRTDELGAVTSYTYDAEGRVLTRTTVGENTACVTYVYSDDSFDRRPWATTESVNGTVTRQATFTDAELMDGGRVETTTDCGLTTVRTYWPAASENRFEAGKLRGILRPDGRLTVCAYDEETLTETVTEGLADANGNLILVSGKSTRTLTAYDIRGNAVRIAREAYIGTDWVPLTWEERAYNAAHRHTGSVWSDGKTYASEWNCTGPLWEIGTDGILTTNTYDSLKRLVSGTREGPHGTLTTTHVYDAAGREVRTVRGSLTSSRTYDLSGRLLTETDEQGRVTAYAYPDAQTTVVTLPGGGTRITTLNADGRVASVTGTAVTPEYHTYGPNWTEVRYGTPDGARWVRTETDGLGRTLREIRGGANGSTLTTAHTYNDKGQLVRTESTGQAPVIYTYDAWGDRVSTQVGDREPQTRTQAYILVDGEPWLETVTSVAGLVQRVRTDAEGECQVATDVRGNETVTAIEEEGARRTVTTAFPGIANPSVEVSVDGVTVSAVSPSGVTSSATYDAYLRPLTQTDGRGNVTTNVYDDLGRLVSMTDAAGATTAYGYDDAGRLSAVTNALGNVTVYGYDLRGNRTYEGGSVYPVTYAYDAFGQQVGMTTYRDETSGEGDTTAWAYDEATGALTAKTYADGRGVTYTLTDLGQQATRTDARGIVTAYAYNLYGDLVSQSYSDATPAVTYAYDALGRQTQATDAVGTTVFAYNAYGEQESETVSGLYSKTLTRHRDAYGRDTGYSLDGSRKVTVEYDGDTGRIGRAQMGGGWMSWDYLPGTDLKSSLTYPNGATAAWTYEDDRDLLTRVANTVNGTVTSQYDYTHDLLGRRTAIAKSGSMMAAAENQTYGYNTRDELISGQGLTYAYDDIGNRTAAEGRTYAANSLNQYTAIDTFEPEYDADGNQTRVLTSTGEWTVEYNAENRPVRWTQDGIVITMAYDRMGRRVEYRETRDGAHYMHAKYVYDGYLCVQRLYGATGRVYQAFAWDPTEPVATRPLMLQVPDWGSTLFYAHDGNKNVSEVFYYALGNGIAAHYDYAPFGAVTRTAKATSVARDILSENPFRFSQPQGRTVARKGSR